MRVLRRGEEGPAVAEVRSTLTALGLLPSNDGSGELFDEAVEHAVRTFQQQRGLITDGVVGPATYRALRDATFKLGARPLAYLVSAPVSGDDVLTLQERLLELGYDAGRPNGVFGAQTEAALRNFQRDYGHQPISGRQLRTTPFRGRDSHRTYIVRAGRICQLFMGLLPRRDLKILFVYHEIDSRWF